jgi:hypothetical protein
MSDPVTARYAQDTAKELSVAFGSYEATARTRPMSHGDLWFLTARFIGLKIEKAQADPPQDALVQFCVFGVASFLGTNCLPQPLLRLRSIKGHVVRHSKFPALMTDLGSLASETTGDPPAYVRSSFKSGQSSRALRMSA